MGLGYKTWASGDILTAADVMGYLMKQAVIVCTSGTRPGSPDTGMHIYETDTHKMQKWDFGAWKPVCSSRSSTITPTLTSTGTSPTLGTGSTAIGFYTYFPDAISYTFFFKFGTSGVAAGTGNYQVSVPVTGATPFGSSLHPAVGTIQLADSSSGAFSAGTCYLDAGAGSFLGMVTNSGIVGATVPWTWAASDYISGSIVYPV